MKQKNPSRKNLPQSILPPYIRQELIPSDLMTEYRKRFKTIYDRADIYIPFIEKSLLLLEEKGTLGFICSDRWMKNRYGRPLRQLINEKFFFKYHIGRPHLRPGRS